jgi:hypothetical protein
MSMMDDYEDGAETSSRRRLTKYQVDVLESQFRADPKPDSNVKRQLAVQTQLSLSRVAVRLDISFSSLSTNSCRIGFKTVEPGRNSSRDRRNSR